MVATIGRFLNQIAVYLSLACGLAAAYFLYVTFREWRARARAAFGVERDIAQGEMLGAAARAAVFVTIGLVVFGVGWLGGQAEGDEQEATRPPQVQITPQLSPPPTPQLGEPTPETTPATPLPTLPPEFGETAELPTLMPTSLVSPTPARQTARVAVFGGVWLRDAPNGGTIVVLPLETVVEFLEGREFAGAEDWQHVRVLSVPPNSEAQAGQEGWVAAQYLELNP